MWLFPFRRRNESKIFTEKELEILGLTAEDADLLLRSKKQLQKDLELCKELSKLHEARCKIESEQMRELIHELGDIRVTQEDIRITQIVADLQAINEAHNLELEGWVANQNKIQVINVVLLQGVNKRRILDVLEKRSSGPHNDSDLFSERHTQLEKMIQFYRDDDDDDDTSPTPLIIGVR